jgi:hypothetical protein
MQVKSFITTVGLSAIAGAATVLMMSKNSKVYQVADDTAQAIKTQAGRILDTMGKQ